MGREKGQGVVPSFFALGRQGVEQPTPDGGRFIRAEVDAGAL